MNLTDVTAMVAGVPAAAEFAYEQTADRPAAELARLLAAIRDARAGLAEMADAITPTLIAALPDRVLDVEGLGRVEVKRATRRTAWDKPALLSHTLARLADEPGVFHDLDGGMLPFQTIGANVARRLADCISMGGGKVTGLRDLGIDPSEFCTEDVGRPEIVLPARQLT